MIKVSKYLIVFISIGMKLISFLISEAMHISCDFAFLLGFFSNIDVGPVSRVKWLESAIFRLFLVKYVCKYSTGLSGKAS